MPELPEVETIRRDLARLLKGRRVAQLSVSKVRLLRSPRSLFKKYLVGASIKSFRRRAKLLLIELSSGYVLIIHLKMTGQLVWRSAPGRLRVGGHPIKGVAEVPNKFTHITLSFTDGSKLFFNDIRQFGYWQLLPKDKLGSNLSHYGPEPLSPSFSLQVFAERLLAHQRTKIKSALLNQQVVAGLGNIYVDESLFVAKIRPLRKVSTLTKAEVAKLYQSVPKVLAAALNARGTSFNTYVDALGKSGAYWQRRYVYGRAGEPCRVCQQPIKRTVVAGRGTHWCAYCQK